MLSGGMVSGCRSAVEHRPCLVFLLFPSLWLQPSGQKGEKEKLDSAVRVTGVFCG